MKPGDGREKIELVGIFREQHRDERGTDAGGKRLSSVQSPRDDFPRALNGRHDEEIGPRETLARKTLQIGRAARRIFHQEDPPTDLVFLAGPLESFQYGVHAGLSTQLSFHLLGIPGCHGLPHQISPPAQSQRISAPNGA